MVDKKVKVKTISEAKVALRSGDPSKRGTVVEQAKELHRESAIKPVKIGSDGLNPNWLLPTMVGLYLIGIAWIVIFYLTAQIGGYPIPQLRYYNFVVAFGFIMSGFLLSTRWK
jgi:hypothetical protein